MTTDPRIAERAALAEALKGTPMCGMTMRRIGKPNDVAWERDAVAILAALPPDWCGHAAILDANNADIRDRDLLLRDMRDRIKGHRVCEENMDAEITRLRDDLAHCERAWEDAGNELARLNGVILRQHDCDHSDCIDREERLRKIEEAAIDLIANTEVGAWPVSDTLRAALEAQRPEAPGAICGSHHPEHPGTTCRRKPGHGGDHATARYDVTWDNAYLSAAVEADHA